MTRKPTRIIDNLGKRHRDLNSKVAETIANNTNFDDVKSAPETNDIDKLFKIDVAAKKQHVDYIVEVLKSADSLHTTRALKKCPWLFGDEYTHIINPEYLSTNIFPFTSKKMIRKILNTILLHVRTEARSELFFKFCMELRMKHIAYKFLLCTSEEFKLSLMQSENEMYHREITEKSFEYLKYFLGNSYVLFEACLTIMVECDRDSTVRKFDCFYKLSNERYFGLVEKYVRSYKSCQRLNEHMSKDLMKKYKERVLSKPTFYINIVDRNILKDNITEDDAKILAVALLPESVTDFWWSNFYDQYSYFLERIPRQEIYSFIKKIFNDKYPNAEFEMNSDFYDQEYYAFMTTEQQEEWAWRHIKSEEQILGVGCDYKWYRFINFKDAFEAIKHYIMITKKPEKRKDMTIILIESAKNTEDLKTLFTYYDSRHRNELRETKESFLDCVIDYHNVFEMEISAWNAFHQVLIGVEIYNKIDEDVLCGFHRNLDYRTLVLLYHIINEKELTNPLQEHLLNEFRVNEISKYMSKFSERNTAVLYEFLHSFYINKIMELKSAPFTPLLKDKYNNWTDNLCYLMETINKPPPENEKIKPPRPRKKVRTINRKLSDRELLRQLKTDKEKVAGALSKFEEKDDGHPIRISNFLKKIKVYFPHDLTPIWLELYENKISKALNIKQIEAAVYGFFQLADVEQKIEFMNSNAPDSPMHDYEYLEKTRIKNAICKFACTSRPPVPISNIAVFIQGDYLKHCVHIFYMYSETHPRSMCQQLVEALIDSPVSVQKHSIRLAFRCFEIDELKKITNKIWNNTKNVSIRGVIYKAVYDTVRIEESNLMFEVLTEISSVIHEEDEDELFDLVQSQNLPEKFIGPYYEVVWSAVGTFKDKKPHVWKKSTIIRIIYEQIQLMKDEFIRKVVDDHIKTMFEENKLYLTYSVDDTKELCHNMWQLTGRYVARSAGDKNPPNTYLDVVQYITKYCAERWNNIESSTQVYLKLTSDFIDILKSECYECYNNYDYKNAIPLFQEILKTLVSTLEIQKIYLLKWDLTIVIISLGVAEKYRQMKANEDKSTTVANASADFGQEVGRTVLESIQERHYFCSFSERISTIIKNNTNDLLRKIFRTDMSEWMDEACVVLANGLLTFGKTETHMLALHLLPTEGKECDTDVYNEAYWKLERFNNMEVKCAMFDKFNKNV